MGLSSSKLGHHLPEDDLSEGSVPSTPILTPKIMKTPEIMELDPRSPSTNICRTPIQMLLNEHLEETPKDQPEGITLDLDPRSPSLDIKRTPIIIPPNEDDLIKTVHKRNIKNECGSNIVRPRLLESSPITSKPDARKRRSIVGVLETNVDFTETDLDLVLQQKCKQKDVFTPKEKPNRINILKEDNVDPRSPTTDFLRTPVQVVKKIGDIDINESEENENDFVRTPVLNVKKICEIDIKEPEENENDFVKTTGNVQVDKKIDEIDINKSEEIENEEVINDDKSENVPEIIEDVKDCIIEEKDNKAATNLDTPPPPVINMTAEVQELDKKLSNLIYEDKNVLILPRVVKLRDNNRTPLGVRNSTGEITKHTQKLRVSDKPRKSEGQLGGSKIPVFTDNKNKKFIQCENTPPSNMDKRYMKPKTSRWDQDCSLVI